MHWEMHAAGTEFIYPISVSNTCHPFDEMLAHHGYLPRPHHVGQVSVTVCAFPGLSLTHNT